MTAQETIEKIRAEVERRINVIKPQKGQGVILCEQLTKQLQDLLSILSDLEKECEEKPTNIDFEQELYKHFGQVKDFTLGIQIGKYFYELGKQEKPIILGAGNELKEPEKKRLLQIADYLKYKGCEDEADFLESIPLRLKKERVVTKTNAHEKEIKETLAKIDERVLSKLSKKPTTAEGLEEEMIAWHKKHFKGKRKWEETSGEYLEHSSQLDLARHFAQWQKDKMMKEAVEGKIEEVSFNNGELHNTIFFSFDEESLHVENRIWFPRCGKDGDKVKLIIVKED